jgi:hypothetical protein
MGTTTVFLSNPQLNQINTSLQTIAAAAQHQTFFGTQLFAALVGGLIGLVPFAYLIWQDRPKIKVKADRVWIPRPVDDGVCAGLSATIYNSGRRSIMVEHLYLRFKDGSSLVFLSEKSFVGASGLPKTLEPSTSHTVAILAGTIAGDFLKKESFPVAVCFSDALGNVYQDKTPIKFWEDMIQAENEQEK